MFAARDAVYDISNHNLTQAIKHGHTPGHAAADHSKLLTLVDAAAPAASSWPLPFSLHSGLPKFRSFNVRSSPSYPNTAAWFEAIASRPAYQKVCSDDQTLQLLFQRMMGLTPGAAAAAGGTSAAAAAAAATAAFAETEAEAATVAEKKKKIQAAKNEAYDKLQACAHDVVKDILAKSGVTRYQASPYGKQT